MTFDSNAPKPFARSSSQRMVGGVCGGISEYFGVDANLVRAGAVLAAFVTGGTAILVYLALWMLLPA
ncbi:PspC domain-containing protein [Rhodococcus gannanensis]|jgi:phage shock protein C|uniref:PspC domain-containing protein n=1 Tax=Rhodococcus gannanensis TaxID=1960308 RepID=A0ABW4P0T1_9NOCA